MVAEANADDDFGSGGVMLLPDQTTSSGIVKHLAAAAGKDNHIYVVDRDSMGKFNPTANNIWQQLIGTLAGGIWGSPAYYNGTVYYGGLTDNLKALPITERIPRHHCRRRRARPPSPYPGATPAISANGTSNGIVWAAENGTIGALHAYDAEQSRARAVQQQSGRHARPMGRGQQVHHADDRARQGVRRHDERRGGVRFAMNG